MNDLPTAERDFEADPAFDALRSLRVDTAPLDDSTAGRIYAASLRRAHPAPRPAARWRRPALRALVVAAAAAVAVTGTALVIQPAPAAAAEILTRAAAAASQESTSPTADDRYLYVEMLRLNGPDTVHVQTWLSLDGSRPGQEVVTTDALSPAPPMAGAPSTVAVTVPASSTTSPLPAPTGASLRLSSPQALADLPKDPQALLDRLAADPDVRSDIENNKVDPNAALWEEIRELSEVADLPTQSALFQAASLIPDLQVVPDVADADGRVGTAIALTDPRLGTIELIFDADGGFLGERILSGDGQTQFSSARLRSDYVADLQP